LSKQVYDEWLVLNSISQSVARLRTQLTELQKQAPVGDLKTHLAGLAEKIQAFSVAPAATPGASAVARLNIATTTGRVKTLFDLIEDVDLAPTPQAAAAVSDVVKDSRRMQETWQTINTQDIATLNGELRVAGLPVIDLTK
jgi:hypothetical protein